MSFNHKRTKNDGIITFRHFSSVIQIRADDHQNVNSKDEPKPKGLQRQLTSQYRDTYHPGRDAAKSAYHKGEKGHSRRTEQKARRLIGKAHGPKQKTPYRRVPTVPLIQNTYLFLP